ncbi:MAG: universal stress protein [Patiriisocius sp.]|uniref:universal stress protein n=1 Tax=Patiriisocius sp. TaxID=2822396 RepID=UPI003EF958F4
MKKIIVPVDFSEFSENALKVAATIAKKYNAEIVAVHMMGLSTAVLTKDSSQSMEGMFYMKLTQKRFEEFLDKEYLNNITVHQTVKNFAVFSEIDDVAKEFDAQLIVMGSHGSSGLSEVFVGSNTEKVVRSANTPVLVIKDDASFDVKTAVFACDFRDESVVVFSKAKALFEKLNIEVKLAYINQPGDSFMSTSQIEQRIVNFLVQLKGAPILPEAVTIYSDFTVEKGIFNFAKRVKADLISLPTHGRRGIAHFFSGSIGEDVVNHSTLPVLTFKM